MVLIAFTNYDYAHTPPGKLFDWVGLSNFKMMFSLTGGGSGFALVFLRVLVWTFIWAFFATFTNYFLGLVIALLIHMLLLTRLPMIRELAPKPIISAPEQSPFLSGNQALTVEMTAL